MKLDRAFITQHSVKLMDGRDAIPVDDLALLVPAEDEGLQMPPPNGFAESPEHWVQTRTAEDEGLPSGAYARVKDPLLGAAHFDERTDRYVVPVSDALAALDRLATEYTPRPAEDEGRLRWNVLAAAAQRILALPVEQGRDAASWLAAIHAAADAALAATPELRRYTCCAEPVGKSHAADCQFVAVHDGGK